jgi:hypothetical protein
MASEINSMPQMSLAHSAASNREQGAFMNMTRQMFAFAPQIGPSLECYRSVAAAVDDDPIWRSRQRR